MSQKEKNAIIEKKLQEEFEEIQRKYPDVPKTTLGGLQRYVLYGIHPGSFLTNLLSNKLVESYAYADQRNTASMYSWVRILSNHIPGRCWGSKEAFKNWSGLINDN